ncbi:MAG: HhH-GPD-type base excision DNA repair protein [Cumulibacter sp.]
MTLCIAQDSEADRLLSENPFALLTGMLLDQQYPMEHAFRGPHKIATRIGSFDPQTVAAYDPAEFEELCATPPAIHRYGRSMARRVQQLAQVICADYGGDAASVWEASSSAADLLKRLQALPGYGEQKARIFAALLGKQLDHRPYGWRKAIGSYAETNSRRSVADVTGPESLQQVREFKKAAKAAAKAAK